MAEELAHSMLIGKQEEFDKIIFYSENEIIMIGSARLSNSNKWKHVAVLNKLNFINEYESTNLSLR